MNKFLLLGAGNMGFAVLERAVSAGILPAPTVTVVDPEPARLDAVRKLGVAAFPAPDGLSGFSAVLLAVKPKDIPTVCSSIPTLLESGGLVVSIAAGVTLASFEAQLGSSAAVCRVMPNINLLSGSGMSTLAFNSRVTAEQKEFAVRLFGSAGDAVEIAESKMDAVTGLSGSGPAYVALFLSALADGGVKSGLTHIEAYRLALQTVGGTVDTLRKLGCLPEQLKNMVSSPGGTTIDAVHSLEKNRFRAAVIEAVETATKKSVKLGAGKKKAGK